MTCMIKRILVALLLALTFCTVALADGQPEDALVRLERAFEESDVALMKDVFDPALLRTIDVGSQLFDMALSPMKTTMTMNSLCSFFAPMTDMPAILGMEPDDLKPGARDLVWAVVSKRQTNAEEAYMKVIVTLEDELISEPGGETLYFRCRDGKWYISVEGLILEPEKKVTSSGPQSALDRMILGMNKLNFKAAAKAYDPYLREIYGDTYTWFNKLLPLGENGKLISETLDKVSEAAKWLDLLSELGGYEMNLFPLFYDVLSCQEYGETAEMRVVFYLEGKLLSPEGGTRIWFRQVDGKWYISEEGIEKIAPKHKAAKEPEDTLKKIKEGLETLDIDLIEEAFDPEIVNYLYAQQGIENKLIRGVTGVNLASVSKLVLSMRPMLVSYVDAPEMEYDIISSKISGDRAILRVSLEVDGDYLTALEGDNMFFRLIDGEWYITYPTKEQYFELFGNECPHLGGGLELDDTVTYEYEAAAAPYQHRVIEVTTHQWSCKDCGAVQTTEERAEWATEDHTASEMAYCSLCGAPYVAPPTPVPALTPTPTATPTATPMPAPTAEPTAAPTATPAPTAVPTVAPTVTPAPTAVPTVAPTATPVPTAVPTVAPTVTPAPTAVPTATPTATPVPTAVPTATPTATPAPTATAAPVVTETPIPAKLPIAQEEGAYQHRTQQAAANSHVVANSGDYSAAMAVDGNEATSWQFSTKKVKLGEAALVIALQPGSTVDELWIKNGFWFINNGLDQYTRNGRPKEIAVGFLYDGESEYSDEVKLTLRDDKERKDWQKLNLGRHENVSAVRIRVISIYKGTKFTTDVAISEVMLVEREGDMPAIVYETLQRGNKSEEVLAMKERLRELGYFKKNADLSNSYNDTCVERVKQFQKVNGLPQTGIADHQMLMLLYSDAALPKSN